VVHGVCTRTMDSRDATKRGAVNATSAAATVAGVAPATVWNAAKSGQPRWASPKWASPIQSGCCGRRCSRIRGSGARLPGSRLARCCGLFSRCSLLASARARCRRSGATTCRLFHGCRFRTGLFHGCALHRRLLCACRFCGGRLGRRTGFNQEFRTVFYIGNPCRRAAAPGPGCARFRICVFRRDRMRSGARRFRSAICSLYTRFAATLFTDETLDVGNAQTVLVHQIADFREPGRRLLFGNRCRLLLKLHDLQVDRIQRNHTYPPCQETIPQATL
jgi:hypothetical protein